MKKIKFQDHILPHLIAVAVFLIVAIFFFKPVFFDNKVLDQHDINQFAGSVKSIDDYRKQTGEEPLWSNSMFSGMPAYLISVKWGNAVLSQLKRIMAMGVSSPAINIYISFITYYILLLAFRVRPYLAIAGALAFGLSSYMIIGIMAGHNGRIGSIAMTPLVLAGIHLAFSGRRVLGFGLATTGLALHLRENHLQITYYLMFIVGVYGLMQLILAVREKQLPGFAKTMGILTLGTVIAAGTYFGPFWAITEYTPYSFRSASEIAKPGTPEAIDGLPKEYAFRYKYGVLEPMTLLIPQFYGGSSSHLFFQDQQSESYQALVSSGNNQMANQLAYYTSAYWGPQDGALAPYYAGAIVIFLFVVGMLFAKREHVWWLMSLSILSIFLSWGDSFKAFNYFMFDYFPGYNKFRSFSFALYIILFAMPLLGMLGLERIFTTDVDKAARKKLLIAFSATGGVCLLLLLFAGIFSFTKEAEEQLPAWFLGALADDRKGLFRADAFRSLAFISAIFILLYFNVYKKVSPVGFYAFLILMVIIDLTVVNKRYLTDANFKRKRTAVFTATEADELILRDKSYFRVYNINPQDPAFAEARTSYFHYSVGGYHGAKMRRYQDFYDSCLFQQHVQMIRDLQQQKMDFRHYGAINMLNIKYLVFGPQQDNIILNPEANGNGWFVNSVIQVQSPREELAQTCGANTRSTAVVDVSKFPIGNVTADSTAAITLLEQQPNFLKYESQSQATRALAVFSEIYYPGWKATIDGQEVSVLRANFLLRAIEVPAGKHTIEFKFEPKPYTVGNKITTASSWLVVLILLGCIGWSLKSTVKKE